MKKIYLIAAIAALSFAINASAEDFLKGKLLTINLKESVAERGDKSFDLSLGGLSRSSSVSLLSLERALEKASEDKDIAMVYINTDHFSSGTAAMEEIRGILSKLKKPVVAYGTDFGNGSYYLASAADKVFMNPEGECSINGLSSTQFFVKDLLDTLGVDIQLIRHGKFKSAGEMYIRNDISPENRLQYEELLGSIWGSFLEEIASSRGISEKDLRSWIDGLQLATAEDMLEKGLVDGLKHRDEMAKYLCHMFGVNEASDVRKISISEYASDLEKGPSSKKIAVLYADGEIVRSGSGIAGEKFSKEIAKVRADSTVKAVVFRVNSPGGEVVAAEMIRREIELLMKDKPVVASYGGYAASGGYLISAACNKIFTDNSTLTGSIGVFGMVPSLGRAMRKTFHVNPVTIGTNEHSTMGSGMKPLSKEEQAWYQEKIEGIYDSFVSTVAEGRSMTKEAVDSLAQGRVWSGKDALENGLADERGTLMDAVRYAADLAGLKKYRIETYPVKKEMSESLMEMLSGKETKKDDDLVKSFVKSYFVPGFHTIARMPEIKINNK